MKRKEEAKLLALVGRKLRGRGLFPERVEEAKRGFESISNFTLSIFKMSYKMTFKFNLTSLISNISIIFIEK